MFKNSYFIFNVMMFVFTLLTVLVLHQESICYRESICPVKNLFQTVKGLASLELTHYDLSYSAIMSAK